MWVPNIMKTNCEWKMFNDFNCDCIDVETGGRYGRQCKLLFALIFNHFAWYWNGINHENLAFPVVYTIFLLHNLSTSLQCHLKLCVCLYADFSAQRLKSITWSNFSLYVWVFFFFFALSCANTFVTMAFNCTTNLFIRWKGWRTL